MNGAIITAGPMLILDPAGVDTSTFEAPGSSMHLLETKNFLVLLVAHSLGTLVGGSVAALISSTGKMTVALAVGVLFLPAGIYKSWVLPAPLWFEAVDNLLAYIPMACIGGRLAGAGREA